MSNYFIIIRGPLGVGKSTISKKLAEKLKGKQILMDNVLKKYGLDRINYNKRCVPAKNFIKANELIIPKIKRWLSKGQIIIFDGCFYHKGPIQHLIKNLAFPYYIFTLKAPVGVCIERDNKRKNSYGEAAVRAVHRLVSKFDRGIIINVKNKNITKTTKEIVKHLLL